MKTLLSFLIILVLIPSVLCTSEAFGSDDPIKQLQGWKDQREAWEKYRDNLQKELDRKSTELDSARAAADSGAREHEMDKAAQAIEKDAPGALKDAFKSSVTGRPSASALWGVIKTAVNTRVIVNSSTESIAIQADLGGVQTKAAELGRQVAVLQTSIQISNAVIDFSSQQIANLQSSGMTTFLSLPVWMQQALNKVAEAQQRQQDRFAAEARAEAARQQAAKQAAAREHGAGNKPDNTRVDHSGAEKQGGQQQKGAEHGGEKAGNGVQGGVDIGGKP